MKIGIVIVGTNAYLLLAIRFIKKFVHFYKGDGQISFFLFTDNNPDMYFPDNIDIIWKKVKHTNWNEGTNSKFKSIISLNNEDVDYLYYFDADTNIIKPFTEAWFIGDLVGGQHFGDQGWMKEYKGFDRNPKSKAYVPLDTSLPQMYYYGAFFGGKKEKVIEFSKILSSYQDSDKVIRYEPGGNDESYINREFHFNPPSKVVMTKDFEFVISDKGGIENMRNPKITIPGELATAAQLKNKVFEIKKGKVYV